MEPDIEVKTSPFERVEKTDSMIGLPVIYKTTSYICILDKQLLFFGKNMS